MKIDTCVIPAAGRATRWLPVSSYLPKDLLPLINKPAIEWVMDEAIAAGCKKIVIVMNKEKEMMKNYLLTKTDYPKKAKISFIYQNNLIGISLALLKAKKIINDKPFVVALPDLPTISLKPVILQAIDIFNKHNAHVVSFDNFSPETARFYGECLTKSEKGLLQIKHFCPKPKNPPKPHHQNNNIRMSGRFIFKPEIFPVIKKILLKRKEGEEANDRTALREAQELGQKVIGFKIKGKTYDTGYPKGYLQANNAFFKKFGVNSPVQI
jgi:UTP--glucose-1-phosphate uridylyltransferase